MKLLARPFGFFNIWVKWPWPAGRHHRRRILPLLR
uniref:IPS1 riboregulator n=1 Tax=Lolium multiflorum TaxID=4521 RepID=A5JQI8_LOLMU|nr:IPS1 riboregulator [Lolium multiflorum]